MRRRSQHHALFTASKPVTTSRFDNPFKYSEAEGFASDVPPVMMSLNPSSGSDGTMRSPSKKIRDACSSVFKSPSSESPVHRGRSTTCFVANFTLLSSLRDFIRLLYPNPEKEGAESFTIYAMFRIRILALLFLTLLIPITPVTAEGSAEPSEPSDKSGPLSSSPSDLITPEIESAITNGQRFLKKRQLNKGNIGASYPVAETSLATLALLASGSTPDRGPYRETIRRGLTYVLSQARGRTTYFTEAEEDSRMHGHGFAMLLLAELYGSYELSPGMDQEQLKKTLESAIHRTRYAQTELGGWGYHPVPDDGDEASVTITQIQALRAARNAGIRVGSSMIEQAVEYVKKSHDGGGRFMYSLSQNRKRYSFALTAAAVSTLNYTGIYQGNSSRQSKELSSMIEAGLTYMKNHVPEPGDRWYYYGMFYAAQAFYFSENENWENWYRTYASELVQMQKKDGSWESDVTRVYSTSLALLILQIPYKYLPIFQK